MSGLTPQTVKAFFDAVASDWDTMRIAYDDERVIERMATAAELARRNLDRLGIDNVELREGDIADDLGRGREHRRLRRLCARPREMA